MDMSQPIVVVLHGADRPPAMGPVEALSRVRYTTAGGLWSALNGAHALFVWDSRTPVLARVWDAADSLRWVHAASAGVDNLLFPGLRDSDVLLTNSRGVFDEPMAEYVLGLVLAFAKDLPTTIRLQQRRHWSHRETERLAGSRALVVGTGPIGRAIGRKLGAAGVIVSGVGRVARAADPDLGDVVPMAGLRAALPHHDWVVLAAPLTPETTGLIDAAALRAMRGTARLVNVGRGGLVVQPDLIDALDSREIAGAAFDVFRDDPLPPSSPLWDMPNVLISPHMSGDVVGWREELVRRFQDNLERFRDGRPLVNLVDKRRGFVRGGS
ncbi:D-2-hydroxyacid dehydrogenase [Actinokineospora sp. PR83]|uniref:D-2-hydroxyacid dehydrogenase n=1 Tax=Actinokineospora sp. PR83 TaxID=2884908 RepID=UPI001F43C204|nr:D-2-hydroxyacid dehydrogenase [Actinokineospora sp. PR83]MCG8919891.1 D-2-hydroxyacid dehydrogenase [Actinokineospora sp. PR83]